MKVLQTLRESRGWSRSELARRAHMHPVTVGVIESGRLVPYPGQLAKLARALSLPAERAHRLIEEAAADGDATRGA